MQEEAAAGLVCVQCKSVRAGRVVNKGLQDGEWRAESRRYDQRKKDCKGKKNEKSVTCCVRQEE